MSDGTGALEAPIWFALPPHHDLTIVIDHRDVVMVSGPIDSAIQAQGVITPLIGAVVPGGLTRRPNRRTPRSVISQAVRDSSPPQDFVLSKSSRPRGQARHSFVRRQAPGDTRHHPAADHARNRAGLTTANPSLLND